MIHKEVINIPFNELSVWQNYLNSNGEGTDKVMKTFTAIFGDKGEGEIAVDIKVCSSLYGMPFIDAVMFQDGSEVGCLEVQENLAGEYLFSMMLKHDYEVIIPDTIKAAKEGQKKYREVEKWLQLLHDEHLRLIEDGLKHNPQRAIGRDFTIETILEYCSNEAKVLDKLYEETQSNRLRFIANNKSPQAFPAPTLERVVISVDTRSDRECPSCKSKNIELNDPKLRCERTEMSLSGYCQDCGQDFRFIYTLFVSDVQTPDSRGWYNI